MTKQREMAQMIRKMMQSLGVEKYQTEMLNDKEIIEFTTQLIREGRA